MKKAGLSLNNILARNLQAFATCRLSCHVQENVLCICLG